MRNKKIIFSILFLSLLFGILIININALDEEVVSEENAESEVSLSDQIDVLKNEGKLEYFISEESNLMTILFKQGGNISIGDNHFENLVQSEDFTNAIKVDKSGNIVEANLYNKEASTYLINGNEFEMPENGHLKYPSEKNRTDYFLPEGTIINKLSEGSLIKGINLTLPEGISLSNGIVSFSPKLGYSITGEGTYEGISFESPEGVLIVKDSSILSDYNGNYILKTPDSIKIQSSQKGELNVNFLEDNGIVDMNYEGIEREGKKYLNVGVSGGDSVELKKSSFEGGISDLIQNSVDGGYTKITDGRLVFESKDGNFTFNPEESLGLFERAVTKSIPLNITSNNLKDNYILTNENNGYGLIDSKTGKVLETFNCSPEEILSTKIKGCSTIGTKLHECASSNIGSGFIEGGRGSYFYQNDIRDGVYKEMKNPSKIKGFDCIGLAIVCLREAYPESRLRDFPPNLKLVNTLESKNWETYIIEPTSVVGKAKATEDVKNIPAGSIVFELKDVDYNYVSNYLQGTKGISYMTYTNSKGNKVYLEIGHTLVRGGGEKNFINAYPDYSYLERYPALIKENNKLMNMINNQFYFTGAVVDNPMIPNNIYLYVMVPPKECVKSTQEIS